MIRKLFTLLTAVMTSATTWAQSTSDIGKVLAADGKMYKTVAAATNAGTTASGIIAYWGAAGSVESGNSSYRGMAIAIEDAVLRWGSWPDHTNYCSSDNHQCSSATSYCNTIWDALNAKNGIAATLSSRDRNGSGHWHNAPCNGYNVARPSGASVWVIPSVGQWKLMAQGLTGKSSEISTACNTDYSYDKLSAKITAVGGNTLGCLFYWSSTEVNASDAWTFDLGDSSRGSRFLSKPKNTDNQYMHVRMVFAFSSATAAVYTISYNANGGSGVPSAQTKDGGIDLTLSSTVPTRITEGRFLCYMKKENLRDNMTNLEIALNILAEASATEISKDRDPKGFNAQTQVAREGGSVAKAARKQLESKLGRSVITKDKASDYLLPEKEESQQEDEYFDNQSL